LQNKIRSEQDAQLNLQRMSLQLRQMNFGREQIEQDRCYLTKINQMKAQAAQLVRSAGQIQNLEQNLYSIGIRLQESAFENAKFTKRLEHEMCKIDNINKASTDAQKLAIIRETFAVHLVLCFFGEFEEKTRMTEEIRLNTVAKDNLSEVCAIATEIFKAPTYLEWVQKASGCDINKVRDALNFHESKSAQVKALHDVYSGLVKKLPQRHYECVPTQSDLAAGNDDSAGW